MSVEIDAELGSHGTFFAGEKFSCRLRLKNLPKQDSSEREREDSDLAVGLVQIIGVADSDPMFVKSQAINFLKLKTFNETLPKESEILGSTIAFDDDKDRLFFSTPVSVLFREITLSTDDSRTYVYETILPDSLPPTHRGKIAKFVYKFLVMVKRRKGNSYEVQEIRLPFKIFNKINENGDFFVYNTQSPISGGRNNSLVYCEEERQQSIKYKMIRLSKYIAKLHEDIENGFTTPESAQRPQAQDPAVTPTRSSYSSLNILDIPPLDDCLPYYNDLDSLYNINLLCQQASPLYFQIKTEESIVALFTLMKDVVRIGDSLHALIDFSQANVRSYHVSATIEQHEWLHPDYATKTEEVIKSISKKVVSEHHENTQGISQFSLQLGIPVNFSPGFSTTTIKVKWNLRVQFILSSTPKEPDYLLEKEQAGANFYQLKARVGVQVVDWVLPIQILPTNPENCHSHPTKKSLHY